MTTVKLRKEKAYDELLIFAKKEGKEEGRLQSVDQIFYTGVDQVTEAQKNQELDLLPIVEKELKARQRVAHIKDWPKIVNSRGKIFRYIRKGEKGDLVGDLIAAGVVLEIGGPMQHGAIIAREYGIPCVSGIVKIIK
jgi:phosphohistidine swiveling domain-containing protein